MKIENVEPQQIELVSGGTARVRVRGTGYGYLICQKSRRRVWGTFDETFTIQPHRPQVLVQARPFWKLVGGQSLEIPCQLRAALVLPPQKFLPLHLPHAPALKWRTPHAPHLVELPMPRVRNYDSKNELSQAPLLPKS